MSPEQARGEAVDRRTDVHALGAVLYDVPTLHRAFEGGGLDVLARVRNGRFPDVAARSPRRPVPDALGDLCRRATAKDPAARPATARDFGNALREWLDGRAERKRRHREAEALAARGREAMTRYAAARDAIGTAERAAKAVEATVEPWRPVAECGALFAARRRATEFRRETAPALTETTRLVEGALLSEPANASARRTPADLWALRLDDAERRGSSDDAAHALTMARRYDDGALRV